MGEHLMDIYRVKFYINVEVDEDGEIQEVPMDHESEEGKATQNIDGEFEVGAMSLSDAFLIAGDYLDNAVGEDGYELVAVSKMEEIQIINWPGDNDECDCAACRTERAAEDDKMTFACICGLNITIVNDFDKIPCPNCGRIILRDRIIGTRNNYILLDIDKEDKNG